MRGRPSFRAVLRLARLMRPGPRAPRRGGAAPPLKQGSGGEVTYPPDHLYLQKHHNRIADYLPISYNGSV